MQSVVFGTNKKPKFQFNRYHTNTRIIKIPSLTDENSHYVFRMKLFFNKTIVDILISMYTEYIYIYKVSYLPV